MSASWAMRRGRTCSTTAAVPQTRLAAWCFGLPAARIRRPISRLTRSVPRFSSRISGRISTWTGGRGASTCLTRSGVRRGHASPIWMIADCPLNGAPLSGTCRAARACSSPKGARCVTAFAVASAGSSAQRGSAERAFSTSSTCPASTSSTRVPHCPLEMCPGLCGDSWRGESQPRTSDLGPRSSALGIEMSRDTNFYYSFLVLPAEKRRAIVAVWDFCRAVDDAVDEAAETTMGSSAIDPSCQLAAWRAELARCFDGIRPETAQGIALQPFIHRFNLPRTAFDALIEGVELDLRTRRYATFHDLYEYCIRVASAVGLMCV